VLSFLIIKPKDRFQAAGSFVQLPSEAGKAGYNHGTAGFLPWPKGVC
jgi:hypothetical protein